jgi:nucleoside-diphosphate-sugar epimerase
MHVLVTGGTGFIGSHVTAALSAAGHHPRLLVRSPHKLDRALTPLGLDPAATDVVVGDAADRGLVEAAIDGCDAVVHAAATVALTAKAAAAARHSNTAAARAVLGAAAESGCRSIVHLSSVSVFSLDEPGAVTVDSPLRLDGGGYSRSKTDIEWYARGLHDAGAPLRVLYPTGVIGADAPELTNVHRAAQSWVDRTPNMSSGINLVDVIDVARAAVAALEVDIDGGDHRFLLNGSFTPWGELYDLIREVTGATMTRIPTAAILLRGVGRAFDLARIEAPIPFPLTHEAMTEATCARPAGGGPAAALLGIEYRPLRDSLRDTYTWMVREGFVPASRAPRLAS